MTPKTKGIMEALADLAFIAGRNEYHTGDSRKDVEDLIQWAIEFENLRKDNADGSVEYEGTEYMMAVENFAERKMDLNRRAGSHQKTTTQSGWHERSTG